MNAKGCGRCETSGNVDEASQIVSGSDANSTMVCIPSHAVVMMCDIEW